MEITKKLHKKLHCQYLEVKKMIDGLSIDSARDMFKDSITNDYKGLFDANYKDILVTIYRHPETDKATLHSSFEVYDKNGNFLDLVYVNDKKFGNINTLA